MSLSESRNSVIVLITWNHTVPIGVSTLIEPIDCIGLPALNRMFAALVVD
jgi:hypothetical protein